MGMFDTVLCEYPLPDARHQDLDFQTKDLECLLDTYIITREGRLVQQATNRGWGADLDHDVEWPLHGDIRIYTSVKEEDTTSWIEYVVRFTHGRVEWIRPFEEVRRDPNLARPDWAPPPLDPSALDEPEEVPEPEAQPSPSEARPALKKLSS